MQRLGILGSTRGTDMLALIAAIEEKRLSATIAVVLSNKKDAVILQRARAHGLCAEWVDPQHETRVDFDKKMSAKLHAHQVDRVVLIGYMRILSPEFVNEWRNKIINVHPSLLPAFAGGMNNDVHQAVLDSGVKETGCTVHLVTEEVDAGPILLQKKCVVEAGDTVDSLRSRVQRLEGEALVEVLGSLPVMPAGF